MRIWIISYRHEGIVICTVSANNCIDPPLKHWHKVRFKNSYAKTLISRMHGFHDATLLCCKASKIAENYSLICKYE